MEYRSEQPLYGPPEQPNSVVHVRTPVEFDKVTAKDNRLLTIIEEHLKLLANHKSHRQH